MMMIGRGVCELMLEYTPFTPTIFTPFTRLLTTLHSCLSNRRVDIFILLIEAVNKRA
jgi:hypothetical protein